MNFIEIVINTNRETSDILMAELAEIGFDTFEETESGLKGYIESPVLNRAQLDEVMDKYKTPYSLNEIEKKNWNEEWEKNFNPIEINGICRVRASFHSPDPAFLYEIVISPKMTFGTGHHSTTALMMEFVLETQVADKKVADIGCGTGILAILASKLQASQVIGIEIEDWSVENAKENADINNCNNVEIFLGKLSEVNIGGDYDVVLANINKNVLLDEMENYAKLLKIGGLLIISGFYEPDIPHLEEKAQLFKLKKQSVKTKENWSAVLFMK